MSVTLLKQTDFFGKFSTVPTKRCIPFAGRPVITRCILSKRLDHSTRMEAETMMIKVDLKGPKQGEEHPKEGPPTANRPFPTLSRMSEHRCWGPRAWSPLHCRTWSREMSARAGLAEQILFGRHLMNREFCIWSRCHENIGVQIACLFFRLSWHQLCWTLHCKYEFYL